MTVYVLVVSWQRDSGDFGQTVSVYDTFEKAQATMREEIKSARRDFSDISNLEEDDYHDGDMSWTICEEGEYCYNHCDVTIYEREVG